MEFHSFPEEKYPGVIPLWTHTNTSLRWEFSYQLRFPFHCLCDKIFNLFALSSSLGIAITLTTLKRKQNSVLLPSPIYINILIGESKVKVSSMHKHVISSRMENSFRYFLRNFYTFIFLKDFFPFGFSHLIYSFWFIFIRCFKCRYILSGGLYISFNMLCGPFVLNYS